MILDFKSRFIKFCPFLTRVENYSTILTVVR